MAYATKYDPTMTPQLVKWMARNGLTAEEIAAELGISRKTLYVWRGKYPDLVEAMDKHGRNLADSLVEDALYNRARGYEIEEVTVEGPVVEIVNPTTGEVTRDVEARYVKKKKKHIAADTTAALAWLNNRQPDRWRQRRVDDPGDYNDVDVYIAGKKGPGVKALEAAGGTGNGNGGNGNGGNGNGKARAPFRAKKKPAKKKGPGKGKGQGGKP